MKKLFFETEKDGFYGTYYEIQKWRRNCSGARSTAGAPALLQGLDRSARFVLVCSDAQKRRAARRTQVRKYAYRPQHTVPFPARPRRPDAQGPAPAFAFRAGARSRRAVEKEAGEPQERTSLRHAGKFFGMRRGFSRALRPRRPPSWSCVPFHADARAAHRWNTASAAGRRG